MLILLNLDSSLILRAVFMSVTMYLNLKKERDNELDNLVSNEYLN